MNQTVLTVGYIVIVFAAMYFLWIAPQNKQRKAQAQMISALRVGDDVVTGGGIYGVVRDIAPDSVELEIADGVVIRIAKAAIAGPANGSARPAARA